jgi:hypothetical protein
VDVLVPFTASGNTDAQYVIAVDKITDATFYGEHLDDLVTISDPANGFQLHKFNFMNLRDFGKFMQVANSYKNHTLLINEWIFSLPYSYPNTSMTSDSPVVVPGYFTPDYYGTGNKICYASYWSKTGLVHYLLYSFKPTCGRTGHYGLASSSCSFFGCTS